MTYSTFCFFHQRFFDNEGRPLAGGSLTFYRAGSTALKPIYLDQSGTQAKNPMPLDSTGLPENQYFGGAGEYDIVLKDANGAVINKALRITASGGSGGSFPDASRGYLYFNGSSYEWRELSKLNVAWAIMDNITVETLNGLVANWDEVTKEKIYNEHFCIASNENEDGAENTSRSKVLWWLSKDNSGDYVWSVSQFDINYPLLNLNECVRASLIPHVDAEQGVEPQNYPAGLWTSKLEGDSYYWNPLVVKEFPEPVFELDGQILIYRYTAPSVENDFQSISEYEWIPSESILGKVKVDSSDSEAGYLEQKLVEGDTIVDLVKASGVVGKELRVSIKIAQLVEKLNERTDLTATPKGPAGGDLYGTYPDPVVRQLTGVGANLTAANDDAFAYDPTTAYGAGRCIASGKAYYGSEKVERKCWTMLSKNANVYRTFNYWKDYKIENTVLKSKPNVTANEGSQLLGFVYGIVPGTSRWAWMWIAGDCNYHWYFSEHIPENYDNDGNTVVWSDAQTFGSVSNYRTPCHVSHYQGVYFLNDAFDHKNQLLCTKDWQTFELVTISSDEEITVPGNDGYGNLKLIERDTGIVHKCTYDANNPNWYKTWEVEDTIYLNKATTPVGNFPEPTNASIWYSSIQSMYGTWVISVAKDDSTNTEKPSFWYSEDGVRWNSVIDSSFPHFWEANTDGVRWFASNFEQSGSPIVYQLLLNQIPAHRQLVAEKGMIIDGDTFLTEMPNAAGLGTDENGKVIPAPSASSQIGDAPKTDYVYSPFNGQSRKWVPNGKASGIVETVLPDLTINNSTHQITVPAYTVQLFDNNNFLGQPLRYFVAASTVTISTVGVRQFVTAKYVAPGVVQTVVTPFVEDLNLSSQYPLYVIERTTYADGSDLIHSANFDTKGEGLPQKIEYMLSRVEPYRRSQEGGLIISSTNLHVQLTASLVFAASTPVSVLAYDSSAGDRLTHAYPVSGVWTYAASSATFDNANYNDGTNLVAMGTNKYKNVWIYRSIGDDKECFYLDGLQYNTSDDAQAEEIPTAPSLLGWHCMLVGRITLQKSATSGYIVKSAFTNPFQGTTVPSTNGVAGGDLSGTYPNPLVDELSGSGNSFRVVTAYNEDGSGSFIPDSDPFAHYSMAIKSEGGLSMFINLSNDVYFSKNGGQNWKFLYNLGGGSGMDLTFGMISSGVYGWAVCGQNQIIWFEDLTGNYDANGYPLLSAWKSKSRASSDWADIANNSNTGDWFFALEAAGLFYSPSLSTSMTFTQVIPQGATGAEGGIFVDQTNNRIVYFERITGRVWWASGSAYSNSTDWTEVTLNGVPVLKAVYPQMGVGSKGVGAGVECKGVCTFVGDVTIYATNVTDASTYQRSTSTVDLPKLWNVCTDGVNVFGTRDDWSWNGIYPYKVIFQLYNDVIPAHKTFVAEKDLVVLGNEYIPNLPNCSSLATDANGKIVAGTGGGGSASGAGYLPTMDYAAATAVGYPPINGTRTEICVLLVAKNDLKLDLLTSVMGASCIQGATGAFIMTIRDVDGNLIANSVTINNPAANTFLASPIGNIQDPITQASLTTYTLKGGTRYYFGIHYGMNGSAFLGTVGGSTTNIRPLPAIRFENLAQLTQHLDMAGTDGSESLFRPYVRVTVTGA